MSGDKRTNKELEMFEDLTNRLILWLFNNKDKKYAINTIIREAYDKGKEVKK